MKASSIYRALLYIAFLLLAGVSPAYDKKRRKNFDKAQLNKEAARPWDNPIFVDAEKDNKRQIGSVRTCTACSAVYTGENSSGGSTSVLRDNKTFRHQ
jgi:hypothetical protein